MQEEERNCHKILIARGTELFERLEDSIKSLNERNITLTGIILATISIILILSHQNELLSFEDWRILNFFFLFVTHFVSYNPLTCYSNQVHGF